MLNTLRGQLVIGVTVTVAIMMGLFTWQMTAQQQSIAIKQHSEQTHALADSLATSSAIWVASRDFSGLQEIVQSISHYPNLKYVIVLNLQGQILAHNDPSRIGLYLSNLVKASHVHELNEKIQTLDVTQAIMLANRQVGWVRIGFDRKPFQASLLKIQFNGLIYALIAIIVSAFIAFITSSYLTRRLYIIQTVADQVQAGENIRVNLSGTDEAAKLAIQFNSMLDSLEARKKQLSSFYSLDLVGLTITSPEKGWLSVNQYLCDLLEYSEAELLSLTWAEITYPDDLDSDVQQFDRLLAGEIEGYSLEKRFISQSGKVIPTQIVVRCVRKDNGDIDYVLTMVEDISQRKRDAQEIEHLAFYDSLTHLANRRLLLDRLQQALTLSARNGHEGALLFLDLDNFKTLNDTLGHDKGDLLLQQVAERLQACIRDGDTVARFGGDEFVILLEGLSRDAIDAANQTEVISHKILSALEQDYQLEKHHYSGSTSIGVTFFSSNLSDAEELLKQADIAMYQAKNDGRNKLRFFDPQMQARITARVEFEFELRNAIKEQQFQLYYQIQLDHSGKALGAEALIRWNHPERGIVPPFDFIPLAEETGIIIAIGNWVLEAACQQLQSWAVNPQTQHLTLSVNVSAKQFHQANFASHINDLIERYNINPNQLKLELTESLLLDNIETTIQLMNQLATTGIQFSLDDFGTGYSSLQYLKRLPLYQLKIDRSFIQDIATDKSDQAIVRTIISMANGLGLSVIAEGVETNEHYQYLLNEGCAHFQGYLFSKPIPIEQFDLLLQQ